ncbi:argininosuccinate lyase-like [Ciona intestinalis]
MSGNETKLWGGRFGEDVDSLMEKFNSSINIDKRLCHADIKGSKAYAKAIQRSSLISADELEAITSGLNEVDEEWKKGSFVIQKSDEDIHTANERRLTELIGQQIAGKLHTGRSRNDQVATDVRLWLKDEIKSIKVILARLIQCICDRAHREIAVVMPGYTHMQRAQPIRWSHWLMSYAVAFLRDMEMLNDMYKRVDVLPLGSGALAGNPFNIDREYLAKELDFATISFNSLDATGNRDFISEMLFWSSQFSCHLSRLSEDLILYSTKEFGFVELADKYSTGSSLMPQKKNPDCLELIRGKCGTIIGKAMGFLTTLKGLPSTYNKDLQEDKVPLFETCDMVVAMIEITTGVINTLTINPLNMEAALTKDMLATDLAYYLVRKNVPFRIAHNLSGQVVKKAEEKKCKLNEVSLEELRKISEKFDTDVAEVWNFEHSVEQYKASGGTSKSSVLAQIESVSQCLNH